MKRWISGLIVFLSMIVVLLAHRAWAADPNTITIPAGTTLRANLTSTLSSKTNTDGDPFSAEISEPVIYRGVEVIPIGSIIDGHITYLKEAGSIKVAEMRMVAETITTPDGSKYDITASLRDAQDVGNPAPELARLSARWPAWQTT
jgi:hypothetical protein